jgi:hypothetical protein
MLAAALVLAQAIALDPGSSTSISSEPGKITGFVVASYYSL